MAINFFSLSIFSLVTLLFSQGYSNPIECTNIRVANSNGQDVTNELQACIDALPQNGLLELEAGLYRVSKTIRIAQPGVKIRTRGLVQGSVCAITTDHACAEIIALPHTVTTEGQGILAITGQGVVVENFVINGNRVARLSSASANACRNKNNSFGYNATVIGSSITVQGSVSKNSLCGTGLFVSGNNLNILDNVIANNGIHNEVGLWADGMTVGDASNSIFFRNLLLNNTDVDLIFGGCQNCIIQQNKILHTDEFVRSSFAAMMIHAWPDGGTSGDYTGTDVSENVIDCGFRRRCGIGLYLGSESWYSAPLFGGFYHDNKITNALNGFLIEKATGTIRVRDNVVTKSGGRTWTSRQRIRTGHAYNIPDSKNVQIEDTVIPRSLYKHESYSREIPNSIEREVDFGDFSSTEFLETVVRETYLKILGRDVDPSGLLSWVNYLKAGHTQDQFESEIYASEEYKSRKPGRLKIPRTQNRSF